MLKSIKSLCYLSFDAILSMGLPIMSVTVVLCISAMVCGCDESGLEPSEPVAVIEGWLNSDGYPVVIFTESIVPEQSGSLRDKLITWGRVTISDGEREVVLTGGANQMMFPPYRYYTYDMKGEPGRTYTITAEYRNLKATATCRMPRATMIDSIVTHSIEGNDTLRTGVLYYTAPDDCPAYYYLTMSDGYSRSRPYATLMGTSMATTPGEVMSIPVFMPKLRVDSLTYVPQLKVGTEFTVHLNRVTAEVFEFWKAYDNMLTFGNNQFISSSVSLPTNIDGGLGVWSAQGSSSWRLRVE